MAASRSLPRHLTVSGDPFRIQGALDEFFRACPRLRPASGCPALSPFRGELHSPLHSVQTTPPIPHAKRNQKVAIPRSRRFTKGRDPQIAKVYKGPRSPDREGLQKGRDPQIAKVYKGVAIPRSRRFTKGRDPQIAKVYKGSRSPDREGSQRVAIPGSRRFTKGRDPQIAKVYKGSRSPDREGLKSSPPHTSGGLHRPPAGYSLR